MRSNRPAEVLVLVLIPSVLFAIVGCSQSASSTTVADARGTQPVETGAADLPKTVTSTSVIADCCQVTTAANKQTDAVEVKVEHIPGGIVLPDVTLLDERGESLRFRSQLIKDKIVVINFIFTTCKGICPPMGANFAELQRQLGGRYDGKVALISVSVDPNIDTPQRLNAWRQKFGGGPGWTLLTGQKREVDHLLKELDVYSADKTDHSPFVLIGDEAVGKWRRVHGLTAPEKLAEIIADLHSANQAAVDQTSSPTPIANESAAETDTKEDELNVESVSADSGNIKSESEQAEKADLPPARKYFTDVQLVNQHGQTMRLYSDVLKDKVVVINSFFSTCKGSCPVMMASFAQIQEQFADRLGKDLYMISMTVDPTTDTPERLASYAQQWSAKPGWYFLTGEKANVDGALYKLGHYVENKESHSNIFIIGNEATGLWKKARGLSKPESLFPLVEEVLNDKI